MPPNHAEAARTSPPRVRRKGGPSIAVGLEALALALAIGLSLATFSAILRMHRLAEAPAPPADGDRSIAAEVGSAVAIAASEPSPPSPASPIAAGPTPIPTSPSDSDTEVDPTPWLGEDPHAARARSMRSEAAAREAVAAWSETVAAALDKLGATFRAAASERREDRRAIAAEWSELRERAESLERARDRLVAFAARVRDLADQRERLRAEVAARRNRVARAVVPFVGPNGTPHMPVVVDCHRRGASILPEGIDFAPGELSIVRGLRSSPFAGAIRAAARRREQLDPEAAPYVLFLVRPSGVRSYYDARALLEPTGLAFGYELIEDDWVVEISPEAGGPPSDPGSLAGEPAPAPWRSAALGSPDDDSAILAPPRPPFPFPFPGGAGAEVGFGAGPDSDPGSSFGSGSGSGSDLGFGVDPPSGYATARARRAGRLVLDLDDDGNVSSPMGVDALAGGGPASGLPSGGAPGPFPLDPNAVAGGDGPGDLPEPLPFGDFDPAPRAGAAPFDAVAGGGADARRSSRSSDAVSSEREFRNSTGGATGSNGSASNAASAIDSPTPGSRVVGEGVGGGSGAVGEGVGGGGGGEGGGASGPVEKRLEFTAMIGPRGLVLNPGGVRWTRAALEGGDVRWIDHMRNVTRMTRLVEPDAVIRPSLMLLVEPGGERLYHAARGQLLTTGWEGAIKLRPLPPDQPSFRWREDGR